MKNYLSDAEYLERLKHYLNRKMSESPEDQRISTYLTSENKDLVMKKLLEIDGLHELADRTGTDLFAVSILLGPDRQRNADAILTALVSFGIAMIHATSLEIEKVKQEELFSLMNKES